MGFEAEGNTGSGVDYDALNTYMVENCGLEDETPVVGIISGIIDLGMQNLPDAEMEYNGTPEQEAEEIAKFGGNSYFKTIGDKRYKCWHKKPAKCIAITVDIPDILVDKSQFFDSESTVGPKPLRMILNGTFWRKEIGCMDLGRVYPLNLQKNEKTNNKWSMLSSNTIYKLAIGAGIIKPGQPFVPKQVIELLGKPLLFKATVCINHKGYYTEKISYAAPMMKGLPVPEYDTNLLYSTGFKAANSDKSIKYLTSPVINRIKLSLEYNDEKTKIKEQIDRIHAYQKDKVLVDSTTPKAVAPEISQAPLDVKPMEPDVKPKIDPNKVPF